jgi:hypothetical protein
VSKEVQRVRQRRNTVNQETLQIAKHTWKVLGQTNWGIGGGVIGARVGSSSWDNAKHSKRDRKNSLMNDLGSGQLMHDLK